MLTLAETDAELKRLAVLKKHHADEQYTARKSLKELPEKITRLERRAPPWRRTGRPSRPMPPTITIGGQICARKEELERLGERLKTLPKTVMENARWVSIVD